MSAVGVGAGLCFLPTFLALQRAGYEPQVNAGGFEVAEALRYGVREAPWFWIPLFAVGSISVLLTSKRRHRPAWQAAAAMMAVSLVFFPSTAEPRLLPPFLVGATLGLGFTLHDFLMWTRRSRWVALPLVLTAGLPLLLWPHADAMADEYFDYYRVVDRSLLDAASFVDRHHGSGVVVVRQGRHGRAIGWWFEGLTGARIAVGSSQRWIGFPEERETARLASSFFDEKHTGIEIVDLAAEADVNLLVFRKWEWIGWQTWLSEPDPVVRVVFDDDEFMILEVQAHLRAAGRRMAWVEAVAYHPRDSRE
jgi:hypothetical protein